jgi:methenyltetrahydromethanopterin cyclohydrolase
MQEKVLIVASSGRMLAQAAYQIGLKPIVIDVFADIDTQYFAHHFIKIPSLATTHLIDSVEECIKRYSLTHVLYGSGFEYYPESLRYLSNRLEILGNQYPTFKTLQEKSLFFSTLDVFEISYPKVSFSMPEYADAWLIKPMKGQGGIGIRRVLKGHKESGAVYWQKLQDGNQYSVLFLADGKQAQVIGFNTQWSENLSANAEFIFSGIINSCDLTDEYKQIVIGWLVKLVPAFGLQGLNSLDFIQGGDGCIYVLEINPRPSASMQLYDADLLGKHILACKGVLAHDLTIQTRIVGYQIIYAEYDVIIPQQFLWPSDVVDIPKAGALINKGQPICSIIAHAKKSQLVFEQLAIKHQQLIKNLEGTN